MRDLHSRGIHTRRIKQRRQTERYETLATDVVVQTGNKQQSSDNRVAGKA